jgi:hypothetical protein
MKRGFALFITKRGTFGAGVRYDGYDPKSTWLQETPHLLLRYPIYALLQDPRTIGSM